MGLVKRDMWHITCDITPDTSQLGGGEPSHKMSPLFRQPLTKGSLAGLIKLTGYMAANLGIEEYLMDTLLKIHF